MNADRSPTTTWTHRGFARVAEQVRVRAGLVFPLNRVPTAEGAIRRAMASLGVADVDRYADIVIDGGAVFDDLMAELTIGETYFFREKQQLEYIRHAVLPALRDTLAPERQLRVWSAGCASGEEAYSLAILLREEGWGDRCRVIGTDVSRPRLAAARRGEYSRWSLRGVDPDVVARYFRLQGSRYQLDPAIRRLAEFRHLNLAAPNWRAAASGLAPADIILCRNVLIYFERSAVRQVAERLVSSLSDPGWLFLGASDPVISDLAPVEVVVTGCGLAYRRVSAGVAVRVPAPAASVGERAAELEVAREPAAEPVPLTRAVEPLRELPPPLPQAHAQPENVPDAIAAAWRDRAYDRVIALAERDVEAEDGDPAVWVLLVRALANTGRSEEAAQACAAALERHRASAELLHLQAVLQLEAGRASAAAAAARRALYLDRNMIAAHLVLGAALAREGETDGARRAYLNALSLAERLPGDAEVPGTDGETAHRIAGMARRQAAAHAAGAR